MMLQLNPSIPVKVVDRGIGEAIFMLDYGKEDHVFWGVALDNSGEVWWVSNDKIRLLKNYTIGRNYDET